MYFVPMSGQISFTVPFPSPPPPLLESGVWVPPGIGVPTDIPLLLIGVLIPFPRTGVEVTEEAPVVELEFSFTTK